MIRGIARCCPEKPFASRTIDEIIGLFDHNRAMQYGRQPIKKLQYRET